MTLSTLKKTDEPIDARALSREISRRSTSQFSGQFQLLGTTGEDRSQTDILQEQALSCPPSQSSWEGLETLIQHDQELGFHRWNEIKAAAREEFESGHRVASANEGTLSASPWQRAQFLAVRESLASQWQPQNGIEWSLVDMMAQAYSAQLFWQERMMCYASLEAETGQIKGGEFNHVHPRVSDSEAVDQAAQMVDRFNRIFMRSLRALRDLRRHAPTLIVQNAEHVNLAQNQVNVSERVD